MSHQDYLDLAPLYALGALDGEDLTKFHEHLSECRECRKIVGEHAEAASGIAAALDPITPPPGLREKLLSKARAAAAKPGPSTPATMKEPLKLPPPQRGTSWAAYLLPVATAASLLAGLLIGWNTAKSPGLQEIVSATERAETAEKAVKSLTARVDAQEEESRRLAEQLTTQVKEAEKALAQLKVDQEFESTCNMIRLKGLDPAKDAGAMVKYSPDRVKIAADKIPALAPGKTVVLWVIRKGAAPQNIGALTRDAHGHIKADMPMALGDTAVIDGFALSHEADARTAAPTEVWLVP